MPRLIFIIHQNVRNSLEKPKIVYLRIKPGTRISSDEDDYDKDEDKNTHGLYLYAHNKYGDKNLDISTHSDLEEFLHVLYRGKQTLELSSVYFFCEEKWKSTSRRGIRFVRRMAPSCLIA